MVQNATVLPLVMVILQSSSWSRRSDTGASNGKYSSSSAHTGCRGTMGTN